MIIPIDKERGIEIITIIAGLNPRGSKVNATNKMAQIKSKPKPDNLFCTTSA